MRKVLNKARDEVLVDRVRSVLQRMAAIKERKMFGRIGLMVRGKLCVSVRPERIMCRIDPVLHDAAVKRKGCQTVVMRGRMYRGYVYVDVESVRTERTLRYWIELALDYNATLTNST